MIQEAGIIEFTREEENILEKARELQQLQEELDEIKKLLQTKSLFLAKDVENYKKLRERYQRSIWESERGLGWCQKCESFHPLSKLNLFYTEELEEDDRLVRRIRSFCQNCASLFLREAKLKTDDRFKRYPAYRRADGQFFIMKNGGWQEVDKSLKVVVEIEKPNISEKDFEIGKYLEFYDYPRLVLKIDGVDFFAKPVVAEASGAKPASTESCGEAKEEK